MLMSQPTKCVLLLSTLIQLSAAVKMEIMKNRHSFIKAAQTETHVQHEVVFAVQQRNIDYLEAEVLERSTPGSPKYQQWMSFEEVGKLTSNQAGAQAIIDYISMLGAEVIPIRTTATQNFSKHKFSYHLSIMSRQHGLHHDMNTSEQLQM